MAALLAEDAALVASKEPFMLFCRADDGGRGCTARRPTPLPPLRRLLVILHCQLEVPAIDYGGLSLTLFVAGAR